MKFVLGDQSPWLRGLLRLYAVEKIFNEVQELRYYFHDLDQAWTPVGVSQLRWNHPGKNNYASIKLETCSPLDQGIRESLCAPLPESVLLGPSSPPIIWWEEVLICQFMESELAKINLWYKKLGGDGFPFPNFYTSSPLLKWARKLADDLGCKTTPCSFAKFFLNPEVQANILDYVGNNFWIIKSGRRIKSFSLPEGAFIAPKREGLVQFFRRRGWTFVGTNIPYLRPDEDYIQIHLEILEEDLRPLEDRVWELFRQKKLAAGKSVKPRVETILPRRPDVLSKLALGYRVRAWTNDGKEVIF